MPLPLALALALVTGRAAAWIETSVVSDAVTVELEPSGHATVSHDLWMKVRGGALKSTELDGIDSDAEPLPDAQVVRVSSGGGTDQSKPLLLSRGDDNSLQIEVEDSVGLRNGTYSFRFSYRTDLRQKSRIGSRGAWAEIAWIGPRYPAGLDVAKVTFRLPHRAVAPRLPEVDPSVDGVVQGELPTAALLSTLRRGAALDELELVRPHVAKGEPVLWRVWASPETFPWIAETKRRSIATLVPQVASPRSPLGKGSPLILAFLMAVAVAMAVVAKHRAILAAGAQQRCIQRPLLALSPYVRGILSGLLVGLALLLSVRFDSPTAGATSLVIGLLPMIYRKPDQIRQLRGPGRWLPLHKDEAFRGEARVAFGRFLDASTIHGKCFLAIVLAAAFSSGIWLFRSQPYLAIVSILGAVVPWTLLVNGRTAELPGGLRERDRRALMRMYRRMSRHASLRVHPIGRFADGESNPDEIRLRVAVAKSEWGIGGLEIAALGAANPGQLCLLVRCGDGTESLPSRWGAKSHFRGRNPSERVYLYTPTVAAPRRLLAAIIELLGPNAERSPSCTAQGGRSGNRSTRSPGNGSDTSKPSKSALPDQATRAA